jgi:hypothetical protein
MLDKVQYLLCGLFGTRMSCRAIGQKRATKTVSSITLASLDMKALFLCLLLPLATLLPAFAAEDFAPCPHFFANGTPPVIEKRSTDRALCYEAFAILHSGKAKPLSLLLSA